MLLMGRFQPNSKHCFYRLNEVIMLTKNLGHTDEPVCRAEIETQGFPGGTVVKNPPASAGDTGSSPGPGRSHMPRSN